MQIKFKFPKNILYGIPDYNTFFESDLIEYNYKLSVNDNFKKCSIYQLMTIYFNINLNYVVWKLIGLEYIAYPKVNIYLDKYHLRYFLI